MRSHPSALTAALFVILSALPLVAIAAPSGDGGDHPCIAEMQKLCPGMKPGPEMKDCLKSHEADFSPDCKAKMEQIKSKVEAAMQELKDACKDDAAKLCKGTQPGGGRLVQCLQSHESELSSTCQGTLEKMKEKRGAWKGHKQGAQENESGD